MTMLDRDQFQELLETYLDGELSVEDAQKLEAFVEIDGDAKRELLFARLVGQRLRELPQPACPPEVTRAIMTEARADARKSFVRRLRAAASSSWHTIVRPSLAVGVFVGIVVVGALAGRPTSDESSPTLAADEATQEEIEQGLNEAKWALAYVSNVGRRTATTIRDDVLDEHVVQPVNRALSAAFDNDENIQ